MTAAYDPLVPRIGEPTGPGWLPAHELFGSALPGSALPGVLTDLGAAVGSDSPAVCAALFFEQYARAVLGPVVTAGYRGEPAPDAAVAAVRVLVVDGSVHAVAFARSLDPDTAPHDALATALSDHLVPVADTLHRTTRVGTRGLRGATAHAAVMALLRLSWTDRGDPPDRARCVEDARAMLAAVPGWAALQRVDAVQVDGRRWFYTDRTTCCLAFRTARNRERELPYCSACPAVPRAVTAELFTAAVRRFVRTSP